MTKYIEIDGIGEVVPRSEYDALVAQVDALRRELQACQNVLHSLAHDGQVTPAYANDAKKVLAATPQQHLAEIRAQAVLEFATDAIAIFGEYLDVQVTSGRGTDAVDIEITHVIESLKLKECANQYADSIRRGEVE